MKGSLTAIVVSMLLLMAGLGTTSAQVAEVKTTLIQNVKIFDGKNEQLSEGMSVLIEGNKIAKIAKSIPAPAGATVIDAKGRVMTPIEVLRQATSLSAELLALSGLGNPNPAKPGVIEEGALADILLFNGNPLEDISIRTKPEENLALIMKDGKIYKNTLNSSDPTVQNAGERGTDTTHGQQLQIPSSDVREPNKQLTGTDLIADDFLGSWPMFGTNMRMKVGGYLKTDYVYDIDGTLDKTQFLMSTIPVEGTPEYGNRGYSALFARETRFNLDVRRITPGALPLRMFLEGDFWSTGNQFRLRHAYIVAGNFIIGQTWTTLSFVESLPFMIDFGAGDALFGGRTALIRYQIRVSDRWKLAVALENLDLLGIENPYGLAGKASLPLPLFAVRADYSWNTGILLLGSSMAQLRWDGGATGPTDGALQFAAVVAGRQYLGKNNYFTWNISYGVGSGENIMAFAGSQANAVLSPDGKLETMPAFAFVAGFMHKWNETLSSNFSYAYGWLETPESRDPLSLKRGGIGHLNLIWRPVHQFSSGIEFMWGGQRVTNDALGRASRIQAMAKFDF